MKGKTGKEGKNVVTKGKQQRGQGSTKAAAKGTTKQELLTHRITNTKTNPKKQPFNIRSYAVTKDTEKTLVDVRLTATDYIGRAVSNSAVFRALVRYLAQQTPAWVVQQILPLIEAEIAAGRVWGTTRKPGKP